ncbi:MAG: phosphosulfolactate synthase [Candidatus Aminicenantes bacterium]|nr:phosphosulfolactate synthase [Candidatus Aminicenantes bacterium]
MKLKAWAGIIEAPVANRSTKPRKVGLTMVIDKGLGLGQTQDLISTAGDYIDLVKLTFGTSAFYDYDLLKKKIELFEKAEIKVMPGGTFLEVALWQDRLEAYLDRARKLGFSTIEVSDGTLDISPVLRQKVIKECLTRGFIVISEVGKKDPKETPPLSFLIEQARRDLADGVFKVIIEAREAGRGVGIFDQEGKTKEDELEKIIEAIGNPEVLIWEAPLKNQQQDLILRLGCNVNLGNIPPDEVLALEALRQGLRGDTLKRAVKGILG